MYQRSAVRGREARMHVGLYIQLATGLTRLKVVWACSRTAEVSRSEAGTRVHLLFPPTLVNPASVGAREPPAERRRPSRRSTTRTGRTGSTSSTTGTSPRTSRAPRSLRDPTKRMGRGRWGPLGPADRTRTAANPGRTTHGVGRPGETGHRPHGRAFRPYGRTTKPPGQVASRRHPRAQGQASPPAGRGIC